MRDDRLSKESLILYALGILPTIWFALLVAPFTDGGITEIIQNLSEAFAKPFNIVFCENSLKTVLIFLVAYAL